MSHIHLPRRLCQDLTTALQREWLVTNGLGGFAAGTVAGALTRRYHGLLIAALRPPVGRRLLVTKLDDTAMLEGQRCQLYTNIWKSGVEQPSGCQYIERFDLVLNVPTWTYALGRARLTKRIWMEPGHNATFVSYELAADSPPLVLLCRLLVNDRDHHHVVHGGDRTFQVHVTGEQLEVRPPEAGVPVRVHCTGLPRNAVRWQVDYTWCHDFDLRIEAARGYDHLESHLVIGLCRMDMQPGQAVTFALSAGPDEAPNVRGALGRAERHARECVQTWTQHVQRRSVAVPAAESRRDDTASIALQQLVLAADQFVVARPVKGAPGGQTLIAGYPWFTDWGRDTMISLPGLTLATGRADLARQILLTWARYIDQGMIPNRFPDEGTAPEYHTADATLWYLWAIDQYVRATGDVRTLASLFDRMTDIVACHRRGTRFNIRVGDDGLVYAGEEGWALTWMDAKVEGRAITPRRGKPIELSALWYDALCNMARLADLLEKPGDEYARLATRTRDAFQRFWNHRRNCCFDVLDGPEGEDGHIRPNQIFAVALSHSPLGRDRQEAIVATCEQKLLTWCGLRTLAQHERGYHKRYAGPLVRRDEAYHQGTVWAWLLGPYLVAHYRLHKDATYARQRIESLCGQLWTYCVGSLGEVFDGDEPHTPVGCTAQAWSVAEVLRAWWVTQRLQAPAE